MPGNFSADSLRVLLDNLAKDYVGARIEEGVPVLDRNVNLMLDQLSARYRSALANYIGDGVAVGSDGFRVTAVTTDNDFSILAGPEDQPGHFLVQGLEVTIDATLTYSSQVEADGTAMPELTTPNASGAAERLDVVYIDAWLDEVDSDNDPTIDLRNSRDLGMRTSTRLLPKWLVRVREGAAAVPQPGDADYVDGHFYAEIAQFERLADQAQIQESHILDTRSTQLTLADIYERFLRFEDDFIQMFLHNQIPRGELASDAFVAAIDTSAPLPYPISVSGGVAYIQGRPFEFSAGESIQLAIQSSLPVMHRLIVAQVVDEVPSIAIIDGTLDNVEPIPAANQLVLHRITQNSGDDTYTLVDYRMFGRMEADEGYFPETVEAGFETGPPDDVMFRVGYPEDLSKRSRRSAERQLRIGPLDTRAFRYQKSEGARSYIGEWSLDATAPPVGLENTPQVHRYVICGAELARVGNAGEISRSGTSVTLTSQNGLPVSLELISSLENLPVGATILAFEVNAYSDVATGNARVVLRRRFQDGTQGEEFSLPTSMASTATTTRMAVALAPPPDPPPPVVVDDTSYFTLEAFGNDDGLTVVATTINHVIVEYATGTAWPSYPWSPPS